MTESNLPVPPRMILVEQYQRIRAELVRHAEGVVNLILHELDRLPDSLIECGSLRFRYNRELACFTITATVDHPSSQRGRNIPCEGRYVGEVLERLALSLSEIYGDRAASILAGDGFREIRLKLY